MNLHKQRGEGGNEAIEGQKGANCEMGREAGAQRVPRNGKASTTKPSPKSRIASLSKGIGAMMMSMVGTSKSDFETVRAQCLLAALSLHILLFWIFWPRPSIQLVALHCFGRVISQWSRLNTLWMQKGVVFLVLTLALLEDLGTLLKKA